MNVNRGYLSVIIWIRKLKVYIYTNCQLQSTTTGHSTRGKNIHRRKYYKLLITQHEVQVALQI